MLWRENILMAPYDKLPEIEFIAQNLHIVSTGTAVAEMKHDKFIPDHAFALSVAANNDYFQSIDLTKEQALQFLRKEVLKLPEAKKGFTRMTYQNVSLGWANILDNRMNNLYPSNWRIRMSGTDNDL